MGMFFFVYNDEHLHLPFPDRSLVNNRRLHKTNPYRLVFTFLYGIFTISHTRIVI